MILNIKIYIEIYIVGYDMMINITRRQYRCHRCEIFFERRQTSHTLLNIQCASRT